MASQVFILFAISCTASSNLEVLSLFFEVKGVLELGAAAAAAGCWVAVLEAAVLGMGVVLPEGPGVSPSLLSSGTSSPGGGRGAGGGGAEVSGSGTDN